MKNILRLTACVGLLWLGIQGITQAGEVNPNQIADDYHSNIQAQLYQPRNNNYPWRQNNDYPWRRNNGYSWRNNNNYPRQQRVINNNDCYCQPSLNCNYSRQRYNNYRDNYYRNNRSYYPARRYYYQNYPSNGFSIEYYQSY